MKDQRIKCLCCLLSYSGVLSVVEVSVVEVVFLFLDDDKDEVVGGEESRNILYGASLPLSSSACTLHTQPAVQYTATTMQSNKDVSLANI